MAAYPTSAAVGSTAEPYRATKLWNAAIEAFCQGMPTGTRRFLLRQYDSSFTASEAVDWLHQYLRSSDDFGPSVTRHQTVQLLQKFLSAGIFTEVRGKGSSFHDNKNIYRFTESCRTVCSQAPLSARDTNTLPVESCPGGEKPAVMNKPLKAKAPAPPVDPQLELQAWNQAILKRLTELLGEDWVCRMIDRYCINSSHMKHTVTRRSRSGIVEPTDEKDDVPHWVLSAMKCLANWRTDSEEAEEWQSCYSGFELDVLKVISEYFQGLEQPLLHPVSASLINRLLDDEHVGVQMATTTEALQLCCLLSHPNDYRKLQLLVRFMTSVANNPSLTLHPSLPARTLMLKIFTWCIVRGSSHQQNQYAYDFGAMQMASYLLDHHKDILVAPPDFQQRVQKLVQRNRPGQRVTFCKQISCEEFENQKLSLSQHALAELLQSILHDSRMPNKVRQRKLKQFKEIYPDIYAEHVAQNKENPAAVQTQTTAKQGFPRIKKPLLKLNSLRF
ncbi:PREDICTED: DEP domain-containing protein 1A-like isoform X3 [Branchiostoma belcheri]|uniref:DEP domain-containing protein 1A-like isoform X3 n=1 Tax=Branchiostoma belcheri TaxID=7741 RepID=A0A6P4XU05_BRABE|nr:PREDICTED: DEP domain-containing protein 1A-like isoform X3 [Branchiostoma belcheri]